jgi:hypothetical protein
MMSVGEIRQEVVLPGFGVLETGRAPIARGRGRGGSARCSVGSGEHPATLLGASRGRVDHRSARRRLSRGVPAQCSVRLLTPLPEPVGDAGKPVPSFALVSGIVFPSVMAPLFPRRRPVVGHLLFGRTVSLKLVELLHGCRQVPAAHLMRNGQLVVAAYPPVRERFAQPSGLLPGSAGLPTWSRPELHHPFALGCRAVPVRLLAGLPCRAASAPGCRVVG